MTESERVSSNFTMDEKEYMNFYVLKDGWYLCNLCKEVWFKHTRDDLCKLHIDQQHKMTKYSPKNTTQEVIGEKNINEDQPVSNLSTSVVAAFYRSGVFLPGLLRRKCVWLSCLLCLMPTVDYISDLANAGSVS